MFSLTPPWVGSATLIYVLYFASTVILIMILIIMVFIRPVSYENRIILRAIILNTHGSREAPKTHGLTYVLLAQNFGVKRRKILVKFCTLKNGF